MGTFPVDDVTPVLDRLELEPLSAQFPDALLVGGDVPILKPNGVHPLLAAVAKAFAEHRPLVLTPDAVWLTIARGIAQHVKLHAEELRPLLVEHSGKQALTVEVWETPKDADSWARVVEQFAKQVGDTLFECDFSTSTTVDRVAGQVAMLDAYSQYYGYWMIAVCGIPEITLTGTPGDWHEIRRRVDQLPRFGLEKWHRSMAPIADHFVLTAEGYPSTGFWRRIYNPVDAYGGRSITGWITRFYPYLKYGRECDHPNPMLDLPLDEPRDRMTDDGYNGPGIRSSKVPSSLCRAVINVKDGAGGLSAVALDAGLAGVTQDENGALRPVAGWALVPAPPSIESVIDRIVAEHETTPPVEARFGRHEGGGELGVVYERIGSAVLFGGKWRLRAPDDWRAVKIGGHWPRAVFELADGRIVAEGGDLLLGTSHWVVCREGDAPEDVPVLGTSLALILRSALDHDGDISQLETTVRLSQLEDDSDLEG